MFSIKFIGIALVASFVFSGGLPWACGSNSATNKNMISTSDDPTGELKVIAEGSMSPLKTTFVGVFRDAATYAALRSRAANLPELSAEFFKSNLVIAAFLGERNTAGYSVAISRDPQGQIRVAEKAPRKDMMVAQVITSPFKMVAVATNGAPAIQLSLDERFRQRAELYRIASGSFTVSGGFAGRRESYQVAGKLQVTRLGELVTIGFAVVSEGTARERTLRDAATGLIADNTLVISKLSRGSLVDSPSGDLRARAQFAEKNRLTIDLDTGPVTVPDGFAGKGRIEAAMVAASAN